MFNDIEVDNVETLSVTDTGSRDTLILVGLGQ